jgi:hypothetical protein
VLLLGMFALWMAVESLERLWNPVSIAFDAAIGVAFVGLVVNGVSVFLLAARQHEYHHHDHDHHHHDHNLRSAYLHVLADTLTSVLAIIALLAGRYMGWVWLDPVMGLVGAALITRWAWGLVKDTSRVLLGYQAPFAHVEAVKRSLERVDSNVVTDLHLWSLDRGFTPCPQPSSHMFRGPSAATVSYCRKISASSIRRSRFIGARAAGPAVSVRQPVPGSSSGVDVGARFPSRGGLDSILLRGLRV